MTTRWLAPSSAPASTPGFRENRSDRWRSPSAPSRRSSPAVTPRRSASAFSATSRQLILGGAATRGRPFRRGKQTLGGRLQIGIPAGFLLELVAGFVGIRSQQARRAGNDSAGGQDRRHGWPRTSLMGGKRSVVGAANWRR